MHNFQNTINPWFSLFSLKNSIQINGNTENQGQLLSTQIHAELWNSNPISKSCVLNPLLLQLKSFVLFPIFVKHGLEQIFMQIDVYFRLILPKLLSQPINLHQPQHAGSLNYHFLKPDFFGIAQNQRALITKGGTNHA